MSVIKNCRVHHLHRRLEREDRDMMHQGQEKSHLARKGINGKGEVEKRNNECRLNGIELKAAIKVFGIKIK